MATRRTQWLSCGRSALFEFRIESADETNVQLEFAKEELYEFYSQLEVIQRQIDALNG